MPAVLLFDTNIWSDLLLGNEAERRRVQYRLAELREVHGNFTRATSRICIAEALVAARMSLTEDVRQRDEAKLWAEFKQTSLSVVELTDKVFGNEVDVSNHAAALRAEMLRRTRSLAPASGVTPKGGKLKLPDAIIAASCLYFSPPAILFTKNVKDFELVDVQGKRTTVADLVLEPL